MAKSIYVAVLLQLLVSFAWCEVLFEESYSDLDAYGDSAKAEVLSGSLDAKFHQEKDHRLQIKDHQEGIGYKFDDNEADGTAHKTLYVSFCFRVLSDTAKEKFSGLVLYQDGSEVLGLGNDYVTEDYSFWASDGKGIVIGEIPTGVDADVHQIIMRIDFDPQGPEKIKVGLDPFCRRSEDRQPAHIWTEHKRELSFDDIRLRSGNSDSVCEFDEIRIGTDWTSVMIADDEPGAYIDSVTENMTSPDKEEMIGDQVARFWPAGTVESKTLPSFVLEKPLQSSGPVPASWELKPQF